MREPGELDMATVDALHKWLMTESPMYPVFEELKRPDMMARWQLLYLDEFLASRERRMDDDQRVAIDQEQQDFEEWQDEQRMVLRWGP